MLKCKPPKNQGGHRIPRTHSMVPTAWYTTAIHLHLRLSLNDDMHIPSRDYFLYGPKSIPLCTIFNIKKLSSKQLRSTRWFNDERLLRNQRIPLWSYGSADELSKLYKRTAMSWAKLILDFLIDFGVVGLELNFTFSTRSFRWGYDLFRVLLLVLFDRISGILGNEFRWSISVLPFGFGFEVPLKLFEIVPYVVVVEVESVDIFSFLSVPTLSIQPFSQSNFLA